MNKTDIEIINHINRQKQYFENGCNVAGALACMTKEEAFRLEGFDILYIAEIKDAICYNKLMCRPEENNIHDLEKLKRIKDKVRI
jgi:hypothetical protein